jgi:hypothetical protein
MSKSERILSRAWKVLPDFAKRPKTFFTFCRSFLPLSRIELDNLSSWQKRNFDFPSPGFVKIQVLKKWGGCDTWIESGTYLGDTTEFLAEFAKCVITIEPQQKYAKNAIYRFNSRENVRVMCGLSEDLIENILLSLKPNERKDISFWLDGHYSADETFKGPIDTPIIAELNAISKNFSNSDFITVFVDDVRCFYGDKLDYKDYPSVKYLADWANSLNLFWTIEHDIFIATNRER